MAGPKNAAGPLIDRVAFDQPVEAKDGYGNVTTAFAEVFQMQAAFIFLRGGETVLAARLEGQQPALVRVRASANTALVTPEWRMRDVRRAKTYAVRAITLSIERGYYDLLVQSGAAA
jgi:head-tail adaptor